MRLIQADILAGEHFDRLIVDDLHCPPCTFGFLAIAPYHWPRLLPQVAPIDRRLVLRTPALRRQLLLATQPARERWRAWRRRGGAFVPAAAQLRLVDERVQFYGDDELLQVVRAALMALPLYVAEAALDEIIFLAAGASSRAWTSSSRFADREGRIKPRTIVLGGDATIATVIHEISHQWHWPLPLCVLTPRGRAAVGQLAIDGWIRIDRDSTWKAERLASPFAEAFAP